MKMAVFCFVALCSLVEVLSLEDLIALMMEAASISETSVNFYQTTQCNKTEDSHLRTHRRENLKSHTHFAVSWTPRTLVPQRGA
jgi:uncharacterized protein (UPF0179 family)